MLLIVFGLAFVVFFVLESASILFLMHFEKNKKVNQSFLDRWFGINIGLFLGLVVISIFFVFFTVVFSLCL